MITLPKIWKTILIFVGIKQEEEPKGMSEAEHAARDYEDKHGYNLTYVLSNKIANLVVTDSQASITADTQSARIDYLQGMASKLWAKKKRLASRTAGHGKVLVIPYVSSAMYFDMVDSSRVMLLAMDGDRPVDVVVLADTQRVDTTLFGKYKRYTLEGTTHTISEFYANLTNGTTYALPPASTAWTETEPLIIQNVKQLLFGSFDCPIDPRNADEFYSAGVGNGMKDLFDEVKSQYEYLANEYKLKKPWLGISDNLARRDENGNLTIPEDGVFRLLSGDTDEFFNIFDPAIRADPIFLRLKDTLQNIENQLGLSRGILTNPESLGTYTNQANIKRAVYDTYAFVTEFRDNMVQGMKDYLYACNVLAEHFALTPQGVAFDDTAVTIGWSNALIEDSNEEFTQMVEGLNLGIVDKVEMRQWLMSENRETAATRIEEIAKGGVG